MQSGLLQQPVSLPGAVAASVAALVLGIYIGKSRGGTSAAAPAAAPPAAGAAAEDIDSDEDSDVVPPDTELKMVFAVRSDLGMSKGKIAAQVGHATLACYRSAIAEPDSREWVKAWLHRAQAKIALKVDSESDMDAVYAAAEAAGLPCEIIEDAGRTEVAPGSRTVLAIGPAPKAVIDKITGPKGSHPLRLLA